MLQNILKNKKEKTIDMEKKTEDMKSEGTEKKKNSDITEKPA